MIKTLGELAPRVKDLEKIGVGVSPKTFPEPHWRSFFLFDPEGNTVEFVCYDPSV